jgi:hypothetical protein
VGWEASILYTRIAEFVFKYAKQRLCYRPTGCYVQGGNFGAIPYGGNPPGLAAKRL